MADAEEVLDDEAADGGSMEVRVPEEWQKVMSAARPRPAPLRSRADELAPPRRRAVVAVAEEVRKQQHL